MRSVILLSISIESLVIFMTEFTVYKAFRLLAAQFNESFEEHEG